MKTSSDCRSGELIQHGLSVAQVGRPKTFGKPLDDRVDPVARLLSSGRSAESSMGNDSGADRVSRQACGHARFIRTSQRRHSDRDRCEVITNLIAAYLVTAMTDRAVRGDFAQPWCGSSSNAGLHVDGIDRTADRRSHTIDRPGRFTAAVRSCSVRSSARHFIGRRPSFSRSSSAQWTRLASGLHRCP